MPGHVDARTPVILGTVMLITAMVAAPVAAVLVEIARLLERLDGRERRSPRRRGGRSVERRSAGEPAWWEEFEREFADYIAARG